MTQNLAGNKAPGTTLIRLCNALLRRLSKTQHAQFSGEIVMYLAKAFPLTEKSGLNSRGAFDVDNITYYEGDGKQAENSKEESQKSIQTEGENSQSTIKKEIGANAAQEDVEMKDDEQNVKSDVDMAIDPKKEEVDTEKEKKDEMYRKFWSLQDVFRDPTSLFNNETMALFKETSKTVITELKRCDSQYNTKTDRENETRLQEIDLSDDESDEIDATENDRQNRSTSIPPQFGEDDITALLNTVLFVPKWLTRRDLFELQLKDVSFRRAVLTQMYILIEFLTSLDSKSKSTAVWQNAINKNVAFPYTLSDTDAQYFSDLKKLIRKATSNSSDFHPPYLRSVDAVLSRDRIWVNWKLKNCPSFGLEPITAISTVISSKENPYPKPDDSQAKPTIYEESIRKLKSLQQSRPRFVHKLGTMPLSQLWKIPIGTDLLKKKENFEIKLAEEYQKDIEEAEEEFRNNFEIEVEVTDDESDAPVKENEEKPKKIVKKLLASSEETREHSENVGSKTWRGLRAARSQGLWSEFGKIKKGNGLSGLYLSDEEAFSRPGTTASDGAVSESRGNRNISSSSLNGADTPNASTSNQEPTKDTATAENENGDVKMADDSSHDDSSNNAEEVKDDGEAKGDDSSSDNSDESQPTSRKRRFSETKNDDDDDDVAVVQGNEKKSRTEEPEEPEKSEELVDRSRRDSSSSLSSLSSPGSLDVSFQTEEGA